MSINVVGGNMCPDNYESKTIVLSYELEIYKSYLRNMNASEEKIEEMMKDIAVIELKL
jgi:hypothetical protein